MVYDITKKESFNNIKDYWYESVISNGLEGIILGIAGNKDDLYESEKVDRNEVKEFSEQINAILRFTSAKNNSCISELIKELGIKFCNSDFMKAYRKDSSDQDRKDKKFNLKDKKNRNNKNGNNDKKACC